MTYTDCKTQDSWIRVFDVSVNDNELIWHRDHHTRFIEIKEGKNWKLQIEDHMPFLLNVGKTYVIPKNVYHRLHRGTTKLSLSIYEYLQ